MLVPQELLSCVVFIGEQTATGPRLAGTAFFVSVPSLADPDHGFLYLVTAEHCVGQRRNLVMRMNAPGGVGTVIVALPPGDNWTRHPAVPHGEDTVDLAVVPWFDTDPLEAAGYKYVPRSMYFDESVLGDHVEHGVGIGDDVIAIGLLTVHYGFDRNEPLVRVGTLSLVPDGPVLVKDSRGRMRLYLTELRSIGGLSGSPLFVRHRAPIGVGQTEVSFLGVLLGHWDEGNNDMGIGMVTPAIRLAEILDHDDLITLREGRATMPREGEPSPVMDSHDDQSEFQRFESLTRRIVAIPKEELNEKRRQSEA